MLFTHKFDVNYALRQLIFPSPYKYYAFILFLVPFLRFFSSFLSISHKHKRDRQNNITKPIHAHTRLRAHARALQNTID